MECVLHLATQKSDHDDRNHENERQEYAVSTAA